MGASLTLNLQVDTAGTATSTLTGDLLTTTARQRQIEGAKLSRLVRGGLDWIVRLCLEKDRRRRYERDKSACEAAESRGFPEWIAVDAKALKGTFKALPTRAELPSTINESLVVELYSK